MEGVWRKVVSLVMHFVLPWSVSSTVSAPSKSSYMIGDAYKIVNIPQEKNIRALM